MDKKIIKMNEENKKEVEEMIRIYHRDMERAGTRFINKIMKIKLTDNTDKEKER